MVRTRTATLFVLVTLLFGTSFPAIEVGLTALPPLSFAAVRYLISAACLLGYAGVALDDGWIPRTTRDRSAVLAGGVFLVGGTGLTFVGQQYTTSGVASIIVSLTPVLTVLFGWQLLPAERISRRGLIGVLVGFVGVALVVRPTPATLFDPAVRGKLLVLLASASVTFGTVLVRRLRPPLPVPAFTGWSMLVGAIVQFVGAFATGESISLATVTPAAAASVLYLGVVAGAVAFVGYFTLIERVGALEANLVTYLTPPVTIAIGSVFLGEAVTEASLLGFLLIATGFALLKNDELAAEFARLRGVAH